MGDIFDSLAGGQSRAQPQQPQQTVVPAPVANDGGGDVFSQLSNPSVQQPQQPQQPHPMPTVSALPAPSGVAERVERWAANVQYDLKHGTDLTGNGAVLKGLGAHGLYSGNSEGVGDFMGSLPLGIMKAVKGAAELPQSAKRWQGTKDVAGGALQAATIPGSFVAPEAGEAAGSVLDTAGEAIANQAGKAVKAIKGQISVKSVQPKIQGAITSIIKDAASEHGVTLPDNASVRDITQALSDAVRAKARALYQQLDSSLGTGMKFQSFQEQINNIDRAIRDGLGLDPQRDEALAKRLEEVTAQKNAAMDKIRAQGLDPDDLIGQADKLHRQSMALQDVGKAIRASTDVHPSQATDFYQGNQAAKQLDIAVNGKPAPNNIPANIKTAPLFKRIQQLATPNPNYPGTPSRLEQALGPERAESLLNAVDAAHLAVQKIATRNAWIKRGAVGLGLAGLGKEVFNVAQELLSGGQ